MPFKMKLDPGQCRAARALLGWKQSDLAARARVTTKTVADFERGAREPLVQTLAFLRHAFEDAGVVFFDPEEGIGGIGVRLKWGFEPAKTVTAPGEPVADDGKAGLDALGWEWEMESELLLPLNWTDKDKRTQLELWRSQPERWAALHEVSRQALLRAMGVASLQME